MPRGRLIGSLFLLTSFILAVLILTDVWPYLRGPAPETSEWYWPYHLRPLLRWWPSVMIGLGVVVVGWWWLDRDDDRAAWPLTTLVLLNLGLQLALVYADRPAVGAELVDRTLSKASNGYVATAAEIDDLDDALRRFPELMATFDNEHARTHPPGFVAAHWLTERALRAAPSLAETLARPPTLWRCTDLWVLARPPETAATLLVWAWLPPLLASLTVIPTYKLARRWTGARPAQLAALLTSMLPALSIFVPTPDQIFAFLGMWSLLLLVIGLQESRRGMVIAAGLIVSLMTLLSLGNAAWAGLLGVYAVMWTMWPTSMARTTVLARKSLGEIVVVFGLSVASLWLIYWIVWGVAPWTIAQVGLGQHYELVTSLRRYDWWLGYNILDFFLFAGPPVFVGLLWRVVESVRKKDIFENDAGRMALLLVLMLAGINLAGSTRGEVGRLWLLFMPVAAVVAGGFYARRWPERSGLWLIVVAQLIIVLSIGLGWRSFYAVILPVEQPEMTILEPERSLDVSFITPDGRSITLIGFNPPQTIFAQNEVLSLSLIWRADGPTLRPYTVFMQLLDPSGSIVTQQDRWPVEGRWPPTCWRAGEAIADPYVLTLPPGTQPGGFSLVTGLYDSSTGQRLRTVDGQDFIQLVDVLVGE